MKTIITQEDCDKATSAYEAHKSDGVCAVCLIYQAAVRCGVPVKLVFMESIKLESGKEWDMPPSMRWIAGTNYKSWADHIGTEIELPDPEFWETP